MRVLGIDYGERRVGVAVSDPLGTMAFSHRTLSVRSLDDAVTQVSEICRQEAATAMVVGLPLNMDGSSGPMAERVRAFVDRLRQILDVPVEIYDERLSSAMAERTLLDADMSRGKRKGVIDKMAAQVILQGYLDHQTFRAAPGQGEW